MNDSTVLPAVVEDLKRHVPLEIRYKDSSMFMAVLAFLTSPFNPYFQTKFVTTVGNTVYFPSRSYVEDNPTGSMAVLAHEFVHLWDEKKEGSVRYKHAYLTPQAYGLLTFLAYSIFASWVPPVSLLAGYLAGCAVVQKSRVGGLVTIGAFLAGAFLLSWATSGIGGILAFSASLLPFAPWPSVGRTRLELRGYVMSVVVHRWLTGKEANPEMLRSFVSYFTGPDYYFMSWSKRKIETHLVAALEKQDSISTEEPYKIVYESLKKHNRVVD